MIFKILLCLLSLLSVACSIAPPTNWVPYRKIESVATAKFSYSGKPRFSLTPRVSSLVAEAPEGDQLNALQISDQLDTNSTSDQLSVKSASDQLGGMSSSEQDNIASASDQLAGSNKSSASTIIEQSEQVDNSRKSTEEKKSFRSTALGESHISNQISKALQATISSKTNMPYLVLRHSTPVRKGLKFNYILEFHNPTPLKLSAGTIELSVSSGAVFTKNFQSESVKKVNFKIHNKKVLINLPGGLAANSIAILYVECKCL